MSIRLEHLTKIYDGHPVLADLSLEVAPGELVVLLGPSGSGKSTVLRLIAGLVAADRGRIFLDGRDVTELPAQARETGLVFQHYALFHQMTVAENIEFPLSVRGVSKGERHRRSAELLELVGLTGLGWRYPAQLSGGQQQRVALARALAHAPKALLLDEPFGALDARIRVELRRSLHEIQRRLGVPTLFVTHDQEEAFELADRVAVLASGSLVEVGPPDALYQLPQTEFAAQFLGSANLLVGEATASGVRIGPVEFPLPAPADSFASVRRRVQVLFRPEDVALTSATGATSEPSLGIGVVESRSFRGAVEHLRLRLPPFVGVRTIAPSVPFGAGYFLVEASRTPHEAQSLPLAPGASVRVGVRRLHALAHPGLHFLLACDAGVEDPVAVALGAQLARQAHARVTLLACGKNEAEAKTALERGRSRLGSGLGQVTPRVLAGPLSTQVASEAAQGSCDLAIVPASPGGGAREARELFGRGEHHLLFVRGDSQALPTRVLVAVQVGEPGKAVVAFAGRVLRHLGAAITVLTVVPPELSTSDRTLAERFLELAVRTLEPMGLTAVGSAVLGEPERVILEASSGSHDLLVLGTPMPHGDGLLGLDGLVGRLLARTDRLPVLIVRGTEVET